MLYTWHMAYHNFRKTAFRPKAILWSELVVGTLKSDSTGMWHSLQLFSGTKELPNVCLLRFTLLAALPVGNFKLWGIEFEVGRQARFCSKGPVVSERVRAQPRLPMPPDAGPFP